MGRVYLFMVNFIVHSPPFTLNFMKHPNKSHGLAGDWHIGIMQWGCWVSNINWWRHPRCWVGINWSAVLRCCDHSAHAACSAPQQNPPCWRCPSHWNSRTDPPSGPSNLKSGLETATWELYQNVERQIPTNNNHFSDKKKTRNFVFPGFFSQI